jgi:hypothetical protein
MELIMDYNQLLQHEDTAQSPLEAAERGWASTTNSILWDLIQIDWDIVEAAIEGGLDEASETLESDAQVVLEHTLEQNHEYIVTRIREEVHQTLDHIGSRLMDAFAKNLETFHASREAPVEV